MISQDTAQWWQFGDEDSPNQSVLGEEDPGAALDSMPQAAEDEALRDAMGRERNTCDTYGPPAVSPERDRVERTKLLQRAISRWENEGGADGDPSPIASQCGEEQTRVPLTNAELVQLQVRVIALENLVTALLAGAVDQTSDLARAMAAYISPRPGSTPHHLTLHAASQMVHLVERSRLFRGGPGSRMPSEFQGP